MNTFLDGRIRLYPGDCVEVLAGLPEASIDSVVTDPPYGLGFMGKKWDTPGALVERKAATENKWDHVGGNHNPSNSADAARTKRVEGVKFGRWCEVWAAEVLRVLKPGGHLLAFSGTRTYHRMVVAIEDAGFEVRDQLAWMFGSGFPKSRNLDGEWQGWGSALKPAWEPIVLARKPLTGTLAANVLEHGTGGLNIDACRVGTETRTNASAPRSNRNGFVKGFVGGVRSEVKDYGRWPANVIHDGSEEVVAGFPQADSARAKGNPNNPKRGTEHTATSYGQGDGRETVDYRDSGSAARFFYTAKADADDRLGSKHPTVKPLDLMQYLCRLVTPPGGTVLDPFAGTGTTGEAAWREGFNAILIEREPEYLEDIARRMDLAVNPTKRAAVAKTKNKIDDLGPLFAEPEAT